MSEFNYTMCILERIRKDLVDSDITANDFRIVVDIIKKYEDKVNYLQDVFQEAMQ